MRYYWQVWYDSDCLDAYRAKVPQGETLYANASSPSTAVYAVYKTLARKLGAVTASKLVVRLAGGTGSTDNPFHVDLGYAEERCPGVDGWERLADYYPSTRRSGQNVVYFVVEVHDADKGFVPIDFEQMEVVTRIKPYRVKVSDGEQEVRVLRRAVERRTTPARMNAVRMWVVFADGTRDAPHVVQIRPKEYDAPRGAHERA